MTPRNLGPIDTPDNAPRLFDLVTPKDAKFAPAFYEVLRDTLVAKDLEHAKRIAYGQKRWRVVTLAGNLIDTSGTMSGGGTKVSKGLMGNSISADDVRPEVVAKLQREVEAAEQSLQAVAQDETELENELAQLSQRPAEIALALTKAEMTIKNCAQRIRDGQQRIEELR